MRIIEITEDKMCDLAEHAGKMLHYGGKVMECIEELRGSGMGERWSGDERNRMEEERRRRGMDGYGNRYDGGYDDRYGDRYDGYGDRRGVRGTGPYSRYR